MGEGDESQTEVISSDVNSTDDSLQSFRVEMINESLQQTKLLTCEDFAKKSELLLGHIRSQHAISLKTLEEIYQKQVRRNKTSDKMLEAMET